MIEKNCYKCDHFQTIQDDGDVEYLSCICKRLDKYIGSVSKKEYLNVPPNCPLKTTSKKYIVTYDMYNNMLKQLIKEIKETLNLDRYKYVYGPSRGGLPIAVHLSHFLNLKYLDEAGLNCLKYTEKDTVLIVDDIADTGKTLEDLCYHHNTDFTIATLFLKDRSEFKPDYFMKINNDWVVFPWEKTDETPNREGYNE